jgi:hypothetical protein
LILSKDGHLLQWRICKNTFLSFVEVGGGFKDVAVTTTYVDNITGLSGAIVAAPAQATAEPTQQKKRK